MQIKLLHLFNLFQILVIFGFYFGIRMEIKLQLFFYFLFRILVHFSWNSYPNSIANFYFELQLFRDFTLELVLKLNC